MTNELKEFLESSYKLRKILESVLPKEASDYILTLITRDLAHRKYLEITEEVE